MIIGPDDQRCIPGKFHKNKNRHGNPVKQKCRKNNTKNEKCGNPAVISALNKKQRGEKPDKDNKSR